MKRILKSRYVALMRAHKMVYQVLSYVWNGRASLILLMLCIGMSSYGSVGSALENATTAAQAIAMRHSMSVPSMPIAAATSVVNNTADGALNLGGDNSIVDSAFPAKKKSRWGGHA